ncbi:MAG: enoyl-CoA hydratase/isomerase family protein [Gammaproteobacteria bacterium]
MEIEYTVDGPVATIALNRPEKLNALGYQHWQTINESLDRAETDPQVRVVVLTGRGRAFCAGADVAGGYPPARGLFDNRRGMAYIYETIKRLHNHEKPVIASVRGHAVGIAWSMALCCDMTIASETAQFSAVFFNRGSVVEGGLSWLLQRQVGLYRAKEMIYTRRRVSGKEAFDLGLACRLVPDAELESATAALATEIAAAPTFALALTKKLCNDEFANLESVLNHEINILAIGHNSEDRVEGVTAAREKRTPVFHGR